MTTATTGEVTSPLLCGRHHFLLRRLHSLTGIMFGGYILVHLIVNASLIQGHQTRDMFQIQVDKIHSLPFLLGVEWAFIYLPILYHAIYGVWIILTGQINITNYPFARNWFYVTQRVSAVILIFFIAFHVLGMKDFFGSTLAFDAEHATGSTARHITSSIWLAYFFYPLGVLAAAFHTANGFWSAAITWGLATSAAGQRRWGYVCAGVFVILFGAGFLALIGAIGDGGAVAQLMASAPKR